MIYYKIQLSINPMIPLTLLRIQKLQLSSNKFLHHKFKILSNLMSIHLPLKIRNYWWFKILLKIKNILMELVMGKIVKIWIKFEGNLI